MVKNPDVLRVVTYNIHKSRGLDGRIRPERIAKVLQKLNADIISLQEVWSYKEGPLVFFITENLLSISKNYAALVVCFRQLFDNRSFNAA